MRRRALLAALLLAPLAAACGRKGDLELPEPEETQRKGGKGAAR